MLFKVFLTVTLAPGALFAEYYGLFQIAEVPTTPRISAMGGAGAALAGGGFGVYNPASPAFADAPFLSCEFGREPDDLSKARLESSWMFPKWFVGASLQFRSTDFYVTKWDGTTDETTMNAASSSDRTILATVTGGYVWGQFAAGSSINFLQEHLYDQTWHAFTFSPGVLFQLVPNSITLGASLSNYLRFDTIGSPWYETPVAWYRAARGFPRYARAGIAWSDTVRRWDLPFVAACDFVYCDVYERFMVPLGAEVRILPSLVARAGACINHPADIVHFGVGICLQNIRFDFDYGISHAVSDVEAKWLFGLSYSLKKKKGEAPAHNGREGSAAAAPPKVSVSPKDTMAVTPIVPPDSARSSQPPAPTSAVPLDSLPLPAGSEPASPAIPPSNVFPEHSAPKADFPELPVDSISQ